MSKPQNKKVGVLLLDLKAGVQSGGVEDSATLRYATLWSGWIGIRRNDEGLLHRRRPINARHTGNGHKKTHKDTKSELLDFSPTQQDGSSLRQYLPRQSS